MNSFIGYRHIYNRPELKKLELLIYIRAIRTGIEFKEQNWPQEDVSNVRNKGSNYPLISHRKGNTETNIKQSPPYGTAPSIEC